MKVLLTQIRQLGVLNTNRLLVPKSIVLVSYSAPHFSLYFCTCGKTPPQLTKERYLQICDSVMRSDETEHISRAKIS